MNAKKRILFVSHAATRNGATILLLHLLRWLKKHADYQLEILVNGSGELISEFQSMAALQSGTIPTESSRWSPLEL